MKAEIHSLIQPKIQQQTNSQLTKSTKAAGQSWFHWPLARIRTAPPPAWPIAAWRLR